MKSVHGDGWVASEQPNRKEPNAAPDLGVLLKDQSLRATCSLILSGPLVRKSRMVLLLICVPYVPHPTDRPAPWLGAIYFY